MSTQHTYGEAADVALRFFYNHAQPYLAGFRRYGDARLKDLYLSDKWRSTYETDGSQKKFIEPTWRDVIFNQLVKIRLECVGESNSPSADFHFRIRDWNVITFEISSASIFLEVSPSWEMALAIRHKAQTIAGDFFSLDDAKRAVMPKNIFPGFQEEWERIAEQGMIENGYSADFYKRKRRQHPIKWLGNRIAAS